MSKRSRVRRVAKWVGVALCITIAVSCVMSAWGNWGFWCGPASCGVDQGLLFVGLAWDDSNSGSGQLAGAFYEDCPGFYIVEFVLLDYFSRGAIVGFPPWLPFIAVLVPTGVLWWDDLRCTPPNHCQRCGYNLTGNVSGICPECGEVV